MIEIAKWMKQGEPIRLIQISDCHLPKLASTAYRGESADAGLKALLPVIANWQPQLIMATGDLSEDASPESYHRLRDYLQPLSVPVYVLPGNHDDDDVLKHHFAFGPWDQPFMVKADNWRLVFIKSSISGRIDGKVSDTDLAVLSQWLGAEPEKHFLLALHHQPLEIGSAWIDRYHLQNPQPFMDLVREHKQIKSVVWGHVHQVFESDFAETALMACPSTAANSLPGTTRFEKDTTGPACRWLTLQPDGTLDTGILFAKG